MAISQWFIYGEIFFTSNAKRNAASGRLDNLAAARGFTPGVPPQLAGSYPSGKLNITGTNDSGNSIPGIRFCYKATSQADLEAACIDIIAHWQVVNESASKWGWVAL